MKVIRAWIKDLKIGDILVCMHPSCEFEVTVRDNKARKSNMGGPVFCLCGSMMGREEEEPEKKA